MVLLGKAAGATEVHCLPGLESMAKGWLSLEGFKGKCSSWGLPGHCIANTCCCICVQLWNIVMLCFCSLTGAHIRLY